LRENIVSLASQQELSNTLRSLGQRSLIEKRGNGFTQQPVVMEYITERLIETVCREITIKEMDVLNRHTLIKAEANDHIKNTQILLILKRVIHKLLTVSDQESIRQQLTEMLSALRSRSSREHSVSNKDRKSMQIEGYAGSNILNLLNQLQSDASDYDVSNLLVWQAYLQGLNLAGVKPTSINLAESVFTQSFGAIFAVDFSPDGNLFVIGGTNGEISLWRIADRHPLSVWKGHVKQVQSVAWSPGGTMLATGSADCTIKLWDVQSGQIIRTLKGHTNQIGTVAWSPDSTMLATGSADKTFRIWNIETGDCLKIFASEESYEETNIKDTPILAEIDNNETTLEAAESNHQ
jgi:WD40 repeat protein